MKTAYFLIPLAAFAFVAPAVAQGKIWRCGNTYTNDEAQARQLQCKAVEGGNVTVVMGTRVNGAAAGSAPGSAREPAVARPTEAGAPERRIAASEQKTRDGEARAILEAELKKAETRLAELQKEYANGEPDKVGPEHKNYQKYLDRVAEMKATIARKESDVAALRRELAKQPPPDATPKQQ